MIFPIPRLIEHISSIMALEVRVRGYHHFTLDFKYTSMIHFHFDIRFWGWFSLFSFCFFWLKFALIGFCFLFFSLCRSQNNQTQPGRRLDSYRNTIRRRPGWPRQSSGMPPSWRGRQRTDQTGVLCSTKGGWLSLPTWGLAIELGE